MFAETAIRDESRGILDGHGWFGMERTGIHCIYTPFCVCLPAPPPPAARFCLRFAILALRSVYWDLFILFYVAGISMLLDLLPLFAISISFSVFTLIAVHLFLVIGKSMTGPLPQPQENCFVFVFVSYSSVLE